jgi:pyrroline-5-carboxylate reductase
MNLNGHEFFESSRMKLGFIGTGAITGHVVTGLVRHGGFEGEIVVSERSKGRSSRLAAKYRNVRVEPENQGIVDQVDMVFLGVLPQQTLEVLDTLSFRAGQTLVSMAAIVSVDELAHAVHPASAIHRIIPMPPNEMGVGPIPVHPPSPELESLLSRIGTVIPVQEEQHFSTFSASSGIMATFYELVATNARWMQSKGIPAEAATRYSTAVFHSLATRSRELSPEELQDLSTDCLTAGGLNEQLLKKTKEEGWYDELQAGLEQIHERVSI